MLYSMNMGSSCSHLNLTSERRAVAATQSTTFKTDVVSHKAEYCCDGIETTTFWSETVSEYLSIYGRCQVASSVQFLILYHRI